MEPVLAAANTLAMFSVQAIVLHHAKKVARGIVLEVAQVLAAILAIVLAEALATALAEAIVPAFYICNFYKYNVASHRTGHVPQSLSTYIYVNTIFNYALSLHPRI